MNPSGLDFSLFTREAAKLGVVADFDVRPEWGSRRDGYRERIRQAAAARFAARLSAGEKNALADLGAVPFIPWLSISHCPDAGGFAFLGGGMGRIGFDLETAGRVAERSLERMSSPGEMADARGAGLDFTWVWAAKEAAYKALSPGLQPAVLSLIRVHGWKVLDGWAAFEMSLDSEIVIGPPVGRGLVGPAGPCAVALFVTSN